MIEVEAGRLKLALQNVLPFAAPKADVLPALEGVKVNYAGGVLHLVATNRYVAAFERITLPDPAIDVPFSFFMPTARVKLLIASLGSELRTVSVREDGLVLVGDDSIAAGVNPTTYGEFPKLGPMVEGWDAARGEQGMVKIDTKWLALLAKVKAPGHRGATSPMTFTMGTTPAQPVKVTFFESFTAYVMPIRQDADAR